MLRINILIMLVSFVILISGGLMTSDVSAQCRPPDRPCTPTPPPPEPEPPPGAPDADGDGVPDRADRCPNSGGPASNEGCPFVDSDGDGTADEDDQCPQQGGPESNNGCPVSISPPGTAPPAVMPTPYPLVFPEEGCYVGNPGPFNVNRRQYPSLNAPITGQLQPGQIVFSASKFTDSNGLLWYGLVIFGDPENNAYIMDWVAASVTVASEGCEPQRINPDDLNNTTPPYRILGWQLKEISSELTASNALVQVCEDGMRVTYDPGEVSGCDDDTPVSFDGMQSLFYCGDALASAEGLADCPGADNMLLLNTPLLLPNAVQILPEGTANEPDLALPGLLLFSPPGADEDGTGNVLVAADFSNSGQNDSPQIPPSLLIHPPDPGMDASSAAWMNNLPTTSVINGYWLVDAGEETTAVIPMPSDDLARYGFNPQPEPPALVLMFPEDGDSSSGNLPDIQIVGFNPQPEPPASRTDNIGNLSFNPQPEPPALNILLSSVPVSYYTLTNPATPNTLLAFPGAMSYVNTQSGNLISCPANLPDTLPDGSTIPVCLEVSVGGSP